MADPLCPRCWTRPATVLDIMARNGKSYCPRCMDEIDDARYITEHFG